MNYLLPEEPCEGLGEDTEISGTACLVRGVAVDFKSPWGLLESWISHIRWTGWHFSATIRDNSSADHCILFCVLRFGLRPLKMMNPILCWCAHLLMNPLINSNHLHMFGRTGSHFLGSGCGGAVARSRMAWGGKFTIVHSGKWLQEQFYPSLDHWRVFDTLNKVVTSDVPSFCLGKLWYWYPFTVLLCI